MSPSQQRAIAGLTVLLAVAAGARAQQPAPRIGYVYPAGGRQGTTLRVVVGGQALDGVSDAYVSGAGVQATVIEHRKPLTPKQVNELRDKLKELQDKRRAAVEGRGDDVARAATRPAWTAEDEKLLARVREQLATSARRPANPAIAETVVLEVSVAANAEPRRRDLRLATPAGLTNPIAFCIGQLPEVSEDEPKTSIDLQGRGESRFGRPPPASTPEVETKVTLPCIANGQILPGDVDRFRFEARKGQRLVVAAGARELIPYLADAVPGWFQATLALYDAQGRELAYCDDHRFNPDPVLFWQIPADGQYVIEIKDAIYRGREDFVYRIAMGELPFVTGVFPLGGRAGAQTPVKISGWNLPQTALSQDASDKAPGLLSLTVRKRGIVSNRVPFELDTLPESTEQEPNDAPGSAQPVAIPVIVNGRIGQSGDWDVFSLRGRAGDEVVAEVHARRLDSPLDSVLRLTDTAGRQLAFNDDCEDKGAGLTTHHADSYLRAKLPAEGTYYVHLGDTQCKGGAEYAYRLRIGPPRPDFELRVVPSSVNVRAGGSVPLAAYALRKDGFSGEIKLALKGAPAGFVLSGARVPANQDQVRLTLTAPARPQKGPLILSLEGRAEIRGREVTRLAVPAEDMMQAFAYRHLVPSEDLMVAVVGRGMQRSPVRIVSPTPVKIPVGGTARVQVAGPASPLAGELRLELSEPTDGITLTGASPCEGGIEIVLQGDSGKVKPGQEGNLVVNVFLERTPPSGSDKAQPGKRRMALGTLPAVPFQIVGQ